MDSDENIVLDVILADQDAELHLPGLTLRLRTDSKTASVDEDDGGLSVQDLDLVREHTNITSQTWMAVVLPR